MLSARNDAILALTCFHSARNDAILALKARNDAILALTCFHSKFLQSDAAIPDVGP